MSQQEIYDLLKEKDCWMSVKEIEVYLDCTRSAITVQLNKLKKWEEVVSRLRPGCYHKGNGNQIKEWKYLE